MVRYSPIVSEDFISSAGGNHRTLPGRKELDIAVELPEIYNMACERMDGEKLHIVHGCNELCANNIC